MRLALLLALIDRCPQILAAHLLFGNNAKKAEIDAALFELLTEILRAGSPMSARVQHSITRQPLDALCAWATRHTMPEDVLVIEASANTFAVAERLPALGRQVFILESHRAGQIGKTTCARKLHA